MITINPYSLFDLAVFSTSAPLAVAFYILYGRISRRRVDLVFANVLALTAVYAFALLMVDNADAPLPALWWMRVMSAAMLLGGASVLHFVLEFVGERDSTATRIVVGAYALACAGAVALASGLILQPRTHSRGPRSWLNVAPWLPEVNSLDMVVFAWLVLALYFYAMYKLYRRGLMSLQPTKNSRRHVRLLFAGFVIWVATALWSIANGLIPINTIDVLLIGITAICIPGAVSLGEQVLHQGRLKEALSKYVAPHLTDEVIEQGWDIGGEYHDVTILFSDIRDFTAISERMAPKDVVVLLSQYFDAMARAIFREGGMLNKTVGDGLLAIFGAPTVLDNHALSAVRSAWDMQRELAALNASLEERGLERLRIGIGLHSGEVLIGNVGGTSKIDYTAIGDVVNVASRVEQHTKVVHRQILMTEATYQQVQPFVQAEPVGEAPVTHGQRERSVAVLAVTDVGPPWTPMGSAPN